MSKVPIFDATLLDHPQLWGDSLLLARPVLPTYTTKNWVPAPPVKGWGKFPDPARQPEPTLKTFVRCLWWWKP
jgi:hypothetical protein